MKKVIATVLICLTFSFYADAASGYKKFVAALATDQPTNVVMAERMTRAAKAELGIDNVQIVLGSTTVKFAVKDSFQEKVPNLNQTPRELLEGLINDGYEVNVCGLCLRVFGIEASQLIDGVNVVGAPPAVQSVFQPGTQVMTF